jgi:RNA polymerase sigma-70 factor (ECF subfamily)
MLNIDSLLASIQRGDTHALRTLYEQFGQQVYSLAYAITQDKETAEEVTQDVFLKVWNKVEQYEPGTNFRAWLLSMTRNQAIDRLRRDKKERTQAVVWDLERMPAPSQFADDNIRWVQKALLELLTDDQREAIELAFLNGLTHEQVASRLGAPLGTIKTRIRDGLQKLRKAWREENPA